MFTIPAAIINMVVVLFPMVALQLSYHLASLFKRSKDFEHSGKSLIGILEVMLIILVY